jgi:hypothetical protein
MARTLMALFQAGYRVRVDDGEAVSPVIDCPNPGHLLSAANSAAQALNLMMTTDMDRLWVTGHGKKGGWILFVYGNGGWDVISDYTTNLDAVLKPVLDYADTLEA